MLRLVESAWNRLLYLAAPETCAGCDAETIGVWCGACEASIVRPPLRDLAGIPVLAGARYASPLEGAVHRLKYGGRPDLGRPLGRWLAANVDLPDVLFVPVPLHPRRLAERGYNQAALIANALARAHGSRVAALALERIRDTPRQALLGRSERSANVAGAFRARSPRALAGRQVALVDDVLTTGATASACVWALRDAGALISAVIALASAGSPRGDSP